MSSRSKGRNAKLVKYHNRALVLKIIQQNGSISRKEIALRTGLTQATITKITTDLMNDEIIYEKGKDEVGAAFGRKPISLAISKERYSILSIHIGRYAITGAVCNLAGEILYREEVKENLLRKDDQILIAEVIQLIEKLIDASGAKMSRILGIGISAPGTINAEKGILIGEYARDGKNGPGKPEPFDWSTIHLGELLEDQFGIPVFADNCSNVAALAESWFGKGKGVANFVEYSVGVGIGAGVVIDGMLYRGEDDVVAEIGHITVDFDGPRCACGNAGCLELYAGFLHLLEKHSVSKRKIARQDDIIRGLERLFREAESGETTASQLLRTEGELLGIGAVSLANIFSPEYIFVSSNDIGDIDLEPIVEEMRRSVEKRAFSVISHKVKVEKSGLDEDIHLYGGIALVMQDFFNSPYRPAPVPEQTPLQQR